ncbi:prolipoprotein diacylglyceryl transferase [Calderihabitans maritimus]|uniref:Phosphatidylglycerol--prolipoprotein diacylglyceryl transferase n=1 Tax=Calderihabitans maritimus TaxID=1246530 RepID=A0A1Z5HSY5_9FIRM|nr:prolipoprotein diacylglyceryl transferase [Calderihabitans maritimus]GAW92643.1 prolipoprotein diacylglyceryl transferase [Calderihabitans maritimus]
MKQVLTIGPIHIYFFGLMIALGALTAIILFVREAKHKGLNHRLLLDGALYSLLGGIVGARLVYVLVYNPAYYLANPMEIIFINKGGLSIHGGILGGFLVGYLFIKSHKLPFWEVADTVAPALILAQGIGRVGCDVFGAPMGTPLPWGVTVDGVLLHPAQVYEFLLDYLLFAYLWLKRTRASYSGQVFLHYLIGYSLIRGIVEFTRTNPVVYGPFTVAHLMSAIGIVIGLILIWRRKQEAQPKASATSSTINLWGTSLTTLLLMVGSLLVYYGVQG